ncbi:MAG: 1-acyl-sn-glycerol-3-phosphate acyltransferase [Chloroflexota bacterium]|nr:hypothetical protein [Chloroflexota bacterium]
MNQTDLATPVRKKRVRKGPPDAPRLRFWFILAKETLTTCSIVALSLEMAEPFHCIGLENIPEQGSFVLAINHTNVRWTPRMLASIHLATIQRRPELAEEWLVIVGHREPRLERLQPWQRWFALKIRRFYDQIYHRWKYNSLRLPMDNDGASLKALREWRIRSKTQPSLVFPEGRAATTFREVRLGSGRWLAALGVPVLPVAGWWDETRKGWVLDFGLPIEWSAQTNLQDLQLGLAIAEALPPEEAPDWQAALTRWRTVHSPEITTQDRHEEPS